MKIEDTVITTAGVFRCCLSAVGKEYAGKEINLGAKSVCPHCNEAFTLVQKFTHKMPCWYPDWQLEQEEK